MSLQGYRNYAQPTPTVQGMKSCKRCGILRQTGGTKNTRTGLCRDCTNALSPNERKEWT